MVFSLTKEYGLTDTAEAAYQGRYVSETGKVSYLTDQLSLICGALLKALFHLQTKPLIIAFFKKKVKKKKYCGEDANLSSEETLRPLNI